MKKFFFLFVVLVSVLLCACSVENDLLQSRFAKFDSVFIYDFPSETAHPDNCFDVYVAQNKSLFGDPNYVISFSLKFEDRSALQAHLNKYDTKIADALTVDDMTYYVFQGTADDLEEYANDQVYDGYYFVYEIIAVNEEKPEVSYLYAYVWDYWKNEFLITWLETIFL